MLLMDLSSYCLAPESCFRRESLRDPSLRVNDYAALFDDRTVLYDVFHGYSGGETILVLPPPVNLSHPDRFFKLDFDDRPCVDLQVYTHPLSVFAFAQIPCEVASVTIRGVFGEKHIRISKNCSNVFQGKRVLLTASRNNNLQWIKDWALFNKEVHGANSVLFYDNGSDLYDLQDVDTLLVGIFGQENAVVVNWNFPWGPGGIGTNNWDSNFGQIGALQHARFRFLSSAASVLNSDIDELCVIEGGQSIFEVAEQSSCGIVVFPGYWIESYAQSSAFDWFARRHCSFSLNIWWNKVCPTKWCVVPSRIDRSSFWETHKILGQVSAQEVKEVIFYGHFRAISNSWKYNREGWSLLDHPIPDLPRENAVMKTAFRKAFGDPCC